MPKITYPAKREPPFDAIVAAAWADEVRAGRGSEGQEFNTGWNRFRVYSTVQGAIDDAREHIFVTGIEDQ